MENSIITAKEIKEILDLIKQYIVFVYPGLITFAIYRFAVARNIDESKNTVIKSISISYVYILLLSYIFKKEHSQFGIMQHLILIVVSCAVPIVWNIIIKMGWFSRVLIFLGINTEIYDNQLDILRYKEKEGVWVRAYMDEQKIMYEGSLRNYESDMSKEQQIILSGYRFYIYDETKKEYVLKYDYSNDKKQWVRLCEKNIIRMEFVYQKEH